MVASSRHGPAKVMNAALSPSPASPQDSEPSKPPEAVAAVPSSTAPAERSPRPQMLPHIATALSVSFATSRVDPAVAGALGKLLPGLTYASVVVCNPNHHRWTLLSATNFARAGPTTLWLPEPQSIAAVAMRTGRLVQSSLLNGARASSLRFCDVATMLDAAPSTKLMVCLPYKPATTAAQQQQQQSAGLEGALLLGLDTEQSLSQRQLSVLLVLTQLLPTALQRAVAATDIFEAVDYMTGAAPLRCPCCPENDEESDLEELPPPGSPCSDDRYDGPEPPPPTQPLAVLDSLGGAAGLRMVPLGGSACRGQRPGATCCAECSAGSPASPRSSPPEIEPVAQQPGSLPEPHGNAGSGPAQPAAELRHRGGATPAAAAGAAASDACCSASCSKLEGKGKSMSLEAAPSSGPTELEQLGYTSSSDVESWASGWGKAALRLSTLSHRRHPLWMTFANPEVEREFLKWHSGQQVKIDMMFMLFLTAALCIVGFCHPFKLVERNPWGLLLGWLLVAPLPLALLSRGTYAERREQVVVVMRLLTVAFINLVSIPSYQSFILTEKLSRVATFWMLTGAESLFITALGLQARFHLHLPLQFACLAVAAWHIPSMCAACYPALSAMGCQSSSMRLLVGAGVVLPSAVLRFVESKSRNAFLSEIRSATA